MIRRSYDDRFASMDPAPFVGRVMTLWRARDDTKTMSRKIQVPEALCERALHLGLQRQREQREWDNAARR